MIVAMLLGVLGTSVPSATATSTALPALKGTTWTVRTLPSGSLAPIPISVVFGADRSLRINTPCNQKTAMFLQRGSQLSVTALTQTAKACRAGLLYLDSEVEVSAQSQIRRTATGIALIGRVAVAGVASNPPASWTYATQRLELVRSSMWKQRSSSEPPKNVRPIGNSEQEIEVAGTWNLASASFAANGVRFEASAEGVSLTMMNGRFSLNRSNCRIDTGTYKFEAGQVVFLTEYPRGARPFCKGLAEAITVGSPFDPTTLGFDDTGRLVLAAGPDFLIFARANPGL